MGLENEICKQVDELDMYIDIRFVELLENSTIKEITDALEKVDNHFMITDDIDSLVKNKIIKQMVIKNSEIFKILLSKTKESFDIRLFALKWSEEYNFYCFLEEIERARDKIYALIVTDKSNNIIGSIILKDRS